MTLNLQNLAAAKLWLISPPVGATAPARPRDLPYLSHALYALIPVPNEEVPTMSCDEWWRIYVNPAWLDTASIPEIGAELAHVCWHLIQEHAGRARDIGVDRSTLEAWTTATDVTIAHTLRPEDACPAHLPTALSEGLRPGRSAEEYFATISGLPAETVEGALAGATGGCGSGADGLRRAYDHSPDADLGAVDKFEAQEIRRIVAIEFRDHVTQRGTDPGDALRWVADTLEPETAWEPILTAAVRRAIGWVAGRGDFTYQRPSRRASSAPGIVLPGQHRPIPRVSIVIDTSGSVDDELLGRALGEVDGVITALGIPGANLTVYSVDAAVHTTQNLRNAKEAKLVGAGGTDLRIGLRAIEGQRPRPDVVIIFTDGDTPWPVTAPPGAVTVIALLGRKGDTFLPTPAWAVTVHCLLSLR
ncbi:vWA domain-containing protein [Microbacterium aurum]